MSPVFSSPVATIIDCGATRTSLGVFKLSKGRLHCTHFSAAPFPLRSFSEDNWLENTATALQFLGAGRRWPGLTALVLPAHVTLLKQIKVPRVDPAKRAKIIRFEAEQAIPHEVAEVAWDTMISGRQEQSQDILLVAVKREITGQLCAAALAAGFRPGRILPAALATLAGFRLARPGWAQPGLVLNLGGRSTSLLQVDGARFAARMIALGGGLVTQQLAENQDCEPEEAERIKLSAGHAELAAEAMETLAGRLAQEISRSVLHLGRQCGLANPAQVFLTGGGAQLTGLPRVLGARLKIPAETFDASGAIEFSGENTPGAAHTDLIGAASIILQQKQPEMNLLPPGIRRHESLRRRQPWLIAAALLTVAAFLPPILHHRQVGFTARAEAAALEEALAPLRARELHNRANLARLELLKSQVARLRSLRDRRTDWVRLLAGLQERLVRVEDVWLEKLHPVPPMEDGPMKLAVSGRMLAPAGAATFTRVRELMSGVAGLPSVVAVEDERFDRSQPGLLRFDFVLVTNSALPL